MEMNGGYYSSKMYSQCSVGLQNVEAVQRNRKYT